MPLPPRQGTPVSPRPERPSSIRGPFAFLHAEDNLFEEAPILRNQPPFDNYSVPRYTPVERLEYEGADYGYNAALAPEYATDHEEKEYIEQYLLNRAQTPHTLRAPTPANRHDYAPITYTADWNEKTYAETIISDSSRSGQTYTSGRDEVDPANPHFGPAPLGPQVRRNKTTKRVALTHGNLVLDCPIPSRLNSFLPRKDAEEFRFMRYSAVTCDPDDFDKMHFTVRPALLNRETQLCIAVTMYNEDEVLFCRTMYNVMRNISHLCSREKSRTWGKDAWKKVVVVIIADGRKAIHPRVLDCLSAMGVYQPGVAKNFVEYDGQQRPVQAHVYEYTTQLAISPDLKFKGLEKNIVPTQIVFVMKENNQRKINSHRWFFNAICPQLSPNICILLDVGTKPAQKSLYYLWKTFDLNSNVGGACGEISVMKGKLGLGLLNPLVACQNFEYKTSNILDKPTESLFGYISVLPGAFSAYRYIALKNDELGHGPLASYFKGESMAGSESDLFTSNMYLAEDRILCFEIVAKRNEKWLLKYVKSALGETDVPDTAAEWISQRRRWLNGSFFAAVYAQTHALQFLQTEHSTMRKVALLVESFYQFLNLIFSWLALANFYIFFVILTSALESNNIHLKGIRFVAYAGIKNLSSFSYVNIIVQYIYAFTLIATFIFALGNRPQPSKWKYMGAMAVFTLLTAYMIFAAVFCIVKAAQQIQSDSAFAQIIFSLVVTYGAFLVSSLLALDPWHLVTCMAQYLLMQSIYINILQTYAFANLHDLSWGTKELSLAANDLGIVKAAGKDGQVEVVLPTAQADIDAAYDESLHLLKTKPKLLEKARTASEKETMRQDYYRNMRTNTLLLWVMSNGILCALVLHADLSNVFSSKSSQTTVDNAQQHVLGSSRAVQIYMIVILSFVAFLGVFRFFASTIYLVIRLFAG